MRRIAARRLSSIGVGFVLCLSEAPVPTSISSCSSSSVIVCEKSQLNCEMLCIISAMHPQEMLACGHTIGSRSCNFKSMSGTC